MNCKLARARAPVADVHGFVVHFRGAVRWEWGGGRLGSGGQTEKRREKMCK